MCLDGLSIPCHGEATQDLDKYIQILHKHYEEKKLLSATDNFREHLKQDIDGRMINKLLADEKLCGLLFANYDAAPNKYLDLILAGHLLDKNLWESKAGWVYSPAEGVAKSISEHLGIQNVEKKIPSGSLEYVLENKLVRVEISKVLRGLHSDEKLSPNEETERKNAARDAIIGLVNDSYYRLVEEEGLLREQYGKPNN